MFDNAEVCPECGDRSLIFNEDLNAWYCINPSCPPDDDDEEEFDDDDEE